MLSGNEINVSTSTSRPIIARSTLAFAGLVLLSLSLGFYLIAPSALSVLV